MINDKPLSAYLKINNFYLPGQDEIRYRQTEPRTVIEEYVLAATVVNEYHHQYRDSVISLPN